jgi:PPOX class probable FMN-dependent enzyme
VAMNAESTPQRINDVETLERLYGAPSGAAVDKEVDFLHPYYQRLIAASPFFVLATGGPDGMDASPRGDSPGFVAVQDEKTLLVPDRRGNNRVDSLRNIIANPRVALLFLVPGIGETLRVNGRAEIRTDPVLLERFNVDGKLPRSVIVVHVDTVFFQCARAIFRSKLWDPEQHIARASLPSTGTIVSALTNGRFNDKEYDSGLYERLKSGLY